ncbi:response regulator [Solidesulfovibrio alcoholivorans]|uniref:response regulator n=1 Tax=Solidesulfovibrio alcoholivorans TaxID=81406 RepID=UPI000A061B0E|nr:response regulator [Solidesulfovibrio alcoholivorans]
MDTHVELSPRTNSISRRLLRQVVLLSLALALALAAIQAVLSYKDELDATRRTLKLIETTQVPGISESLWDFNNETLSAQLEGILHYRRIIFAAVYADGQPALEAGTKQEGHAFTTEIPILHAGPTGEQRLGSLIVQADTSFLLADAAGKAFGNFAASLAIVALVSFVTFHFFKHMVATPLGAIDRYFRAVAPGTDAPPLRVERTAHYDDEIDNIVESVNRMLLALKTAYADLSDNKRLLQEILDAVPQSIFWKDAASVYRGCNAAFARDAGIAFPQNIVGKTDRDLPWTSEQTAGFLADDQAVMASGRPKAHIVEQLRKPDGGQIWLDTAKLPMKDASGRVTGVLGVYTDITERLEAEHSLREAKSQAEAASRSKSAFLANMSHEIRTPLSGMLGMLHLLESTTLTPEQQEYVAATIKSTNRLTRLLSDILDISRVEAGKMRIVDGEFAVAELRTAILELFTPKAAEKNLALTFAIDPALPETCVGDEARILQVLFNLVGNAIKFTESGGVAIEISLSCRPRDREIRTLFRISDTGIGLSDAEITDIFAPFSQVENSFTRRFQGAGLGLSIVHKLVGLMHGEIAIDSTPGSGTTIYVSLPLHLPNPASAAATAVAAAVAGDTKACPPRILMAEDDEISLVAGKFLLEKLGYSVTCARDGKEALQRLDEQDVDCVLMDVQMPVMDGLEATRAIRNLPPEHRNAGVPVIALTAYAMRGDRDRFLAAGIDDYVSKPVDVATLQAALERATKRGKPADGSSGSCIRYT